MRQFLSLPGSIADRLSRATINVDGGFRAAGLMFKADKRK